MEPFTIAIADDVLADLRERLERTRFVTPTASGWDAGTDPAYLRDCVYKRDRGLCAKCQVDTVAAWNHIRKLRHGKRGLAMRDWGAPPNRSSLWDADHIVPVVLGGGQCDLSNMRTLCLRCHREATAALRRKELQLTT